MKNKVFIVMGSLKSNGGGVTNAVLSRASAFTKKGIETSILTFRSEETTRDAEKIFMEQGRVDKRVSFTNIYGYYRHKNSSDISLKQKLRYHTAQVRILDVRYAGKVFKKRSLDANNRLICTEYFNENLQLFYTRYFHPSGYLERTVELDPVTGKKVRVEHYAQDGYCFLKTYLKPSNKFKHYLFKRGTKTPTRFKNGRSFHAHWLNEVASNETCKPIIICDAKKMAPVVLKVQNSAYKVYQQHGNHFDEPFAPGAPIRKELLPALNNLKNMDRAVVLTEKHKQHIIDQFGDSKNIYVIPNMIRCVSSTRIKKSPVDFSMIARLDKIKQIDHAIMIFSKVVNKFPNATLNIYGDGPLKDKIKKLIEEEKLENNVILHGHVTSARLDKGLKRSVACVLTSKYEGLPLSILEAMANGTPAISYDINYGPSDVIENEKTGYLIKSGDINSFAKKITELMENPQKAATAGKLAKERVNRKYSENCIVNQWLKLFDGMLTKS